MESSSNRGDGPAHAQGHLAKVIILGVPTAFASVNSESSVQIPLHSWCLPAGATISPLIATPKFGVARRGPIFLGSVRIEGLWP